jgi:hypothetical protein
VSKSKVIEHPVHALRRKVEEQSKQIEALKIDVIVLKDLLQRTVRMLAKLEMEGGLKKGPRLFK